MGVAMDSPIKPPPLTLLMGDSATETATRLRSLLAGNDEFTVSHVGGHNASVFEVVYHGISLQLAVRPQVGEIAGLKKIFCNLDVASVGSGVDIGLGEHVAGGERVPAIVQGLLDAAQKLGSALGAVAVIWHPANVVSGLGYFSQAVSDYLSGGAFPVLAMVNFKAASGGNIDSHGLQFLAGQELQVVCDDMDQTDLMRRVVRIVHDIAVNGPISEAVTLDGIEPEETIGLRPVADANVLKMTVYSNSDT